MPPKVGKLTAFAGLSCITVFGIAAQTVSGQQTPPPINTPLGVPLSTASLPSAADVMRARIAKVKAYVAVKNYAAAIFELEDIKRESRDPAVNGVVQVMLMNCYLEQLDYKRAQAFLTETFNSQKANNANVNYFTVAGQVVKSARNQLDRYKSLGLSVTDINLPKEAAADVNKMRETVEMVITQSKTLSENKKISSDAMALLEESTGTRANLARDEYDAKRWREELADARDNLMNTRTAIINAVEESPAAASAATANVSASAAGPSTASSNQPTNISSAAQTNNPPAQIPSDTNKPPVRERLIVAPTASAAVNPPSSNNQSVQPVNAAAVNTPAVKDNAPLQVGSLVEYATEKANPTYPPAAKMMRKTGIVRVEAVIDEDGKIADIKSSSGESLLQRAAIEALKKWKFKPFMRDGQAVKIAGYVNFNFNL